MTNAEKVELALTILRKEIAASNLYPKQNVENYWRLLASIEAVYKILTFDGIDNSAREVG